MYDPSFLFHSYSHPDITMTRRTIGLLATLVLAILAALGLSSMQPAGKVPRIGLLDDAPYWEAFRQGLRDLGYVEGRHMTIVSPLAEGKVTPLPERAAELVRHEVDIIVAVSTPAVLAAKQATSTIPIVMVGTGDPLRTGLVVSLAQPGGNITGSTVLTPELAPKRLQLLQEAVPHLARVAVLVNPANPAAVLNFEQVQGAARALGITVYAVEVARPEEFESAFAMMIQERPDALFVTADVMHQLHIERVIAFAAHSRLPAMYAVRAYVIAGGLMSYGPSMPAMYRRAAYFVDRILKGTRPADLPVELPTMFELVINLKTADALGLTIPPSLLFQATEVIR
jgi:putative tryptophan/tyrosine transport system substrate-binding protein